MGVPSERGMRFPGFLELVLPLHEPGRAGPNAYVLLILSVVVVSAGIMLASLMYMWLPVRTGIIGRAHPLHALLLNACYVDWLYDRVVVHAPARRLALPLAI